MFKRKSKKNLPAPTSSVPDPKKTFTKHEEKKLQALAKKAQKAEEKESPVQLMSVKRTARHGEDDGGETTTIPEEVVKSFEDTMTTPNRPAPLSSQTQASGSKPSLKAQSSVHTFSGDNVTSSTSFNFGEESTECDEETVKLDFEEDKQEYEFEVVPTEYPNMKIMRNRLESVQSPRINRSYEL